MLHVMTEQCRSERERDLDAVERQITAEEAEDAAKPDDAPHEKIKTYEGFAGTGATPRAVQDDEDCPVASPLPRIGVREALNSRDEVLATLARLGETVEEDGQRWVVMPIDDLAARCGRSSRGVKTIMTRAQKAGDYECGWLRTKGGDDAYLSQPDADALRARAASGVDIRPSALGSIRACAAEILTAMELWREHPDEVAVVLGGRHRRIDVSMDLGEDERLTADAKYLTETSPSERANGAGSYKVTRQGHVYFPEDLTYVGLVYGDMPVIVRMEKGRLIFEVDVEGAQTRLATPEEMNAELDPVAGARARVAWLPDELLGLAPEKNEDDG